MPERCGIIAGQGKLPLELANSAVRRGFEVIVFPIEDQFDQCFKKYETIPINLGSVARTRQLFLEFRIKKMIMAGKVKWPLMADLQPDDDAKDLLEKMNTKGDDKVLRVLRDYFLEKGIELIGADTLLPNRLLPAGVLSGELTESQMEKPIKLARSVLDGLGMVDVGQSVIVQNGRVLAVEAAEGTDDMLVRSKELIDSSGGVAFFVKMCKSGQDRKLDVPVVGCKTVELAATSGIRAIVLEAGGIFLADELEDIIMLCERHGVSLVSIVKDS